MKFDNKGEIGFVDNSETIVSADVNRIILEALEDIKSIEEVIETYDKRNDCPNCNLLQDAVIKLLRIAANLAVYNLRELYTAKQKDIK